MDQRLDLFARVREAVAGLPGVSHASISVVTPVSGSTWNNLIEVVGGAPLPERDRITNINHVTPDWFATYGTKLLAGRDIADGDRQGAPAVALVNETFARKFLGAGSPIGRIVRQEGRPGKVPPPIEIVGLVRDAVYRSLRDPVPPTMYLPVAQIDIGEGGGGASSVSLSVRSAGGPPAMLARPVLAAVRRVDPNLSLTVRTLSDQVNASLTQERLLAMLSGFFGALALLLAGMGLYGVTSYGVNRRRTEIGIRMALGAEPGGVVRMVLRQVAMLVGAGVVLGGLASFWTAHFAGSLLYGLEPRDPVHAGVGGGGADGGRRPGRLAAGAARLAHRPGASPAGRVTNFPTASVTKALEILANGSTIALAILTIVAVAWRRSPAPSLE